MPQLRGDAMSQPTDGHEPYDGDGTSTPEPENEVAQENEDTPGDSESGDEPVTEPCGIDYGFSYDIAQCSVAPTSFLPETPDTQQDAAARDTRAINNGTPIAHPEPAPPGYYSSPLSPGLRRNSREALTMPSYSDSMPLFARAVQWQADEERCYERPDGDVWLSESEAYDLYVRIAEFTTGVEVNRSAGVRTVLGVRGAYPGSFNSHGNRPNRFDDTLVLLWVDEQGDEQVYEFPANTDTGKFSGDSNRSSLRPNRRYRYEYGWHRGYNALSIRESGYAVYDDGNHNGHWDADRNGWFEPCNRDDYPRTGSAHNIHMAAKDPPLATAAVNNWSAGCQVIPGVDNWSEFIHSAWTTLGDPVDYFLVDVRDIDHRVWTACGADGTHQCPYEIDSFPYSDTQDTSQVGVREYDFYNCSTTNESGPEVVYFFTIDTSATLYVAVEGTVVGDYESDPDIHLLDADHPDACLKRAHISFSHSITPGRYFIIVDTWVDDTGSELTGPYTLNVSLQ